MSQSARPILYHVEDFHLPFHAGFYWRFQNVPKKLPHPLSKGGLIVEGVDLASCILFIFFWLWPSLKKTWK